MLERVRRIAVYELGEMGPMGYDQDGFVTALVAEGIKEGALVLQVHTRDHWPPHVHVKRREDLGSHGVIIDLRNGEVDEDRLPRGVRKKDTKRMGKLVEKHHAELSMLWEKNNGSKVFPETEPCTLDDPAAAPFEDDVQPHVEREG
ncbi:DUF4160 domain-containing protein [Isoptericola sp. NPDC019693]|uniref:DUF4160 domain-containing protein n=1 Tax=Isoptericola sp. NPDC019693 TaxID=3364009 RepID=UPI0037B8D80F